MVKITMLLILKNQYFCQNSKFSGLLSYYLILLDMKKKGGGDASFFPGSLFPDLTGFIAFAEIVGSNPSKFMQHFFVRVRNIIHAGR